MKPNNSPTRYCQRSIILALLAVILIGSASAQQSFEITSLSTSGSNIIEHEPITGDDRGGIALSSTNLFYTGDGSTGSFETANLSNAASIGIRYDALVSNLRTRQVYTLGTAFGVVQNGGDLVARLVPLDPSTGAQIAGDIQLSTPISITSGTTPAGIFAGWDRIVLLDGNTLQAYDIALPSGIVTPLGFLNLYADQGSSDDRCGCENWATWGVAEYSGGTFKLVYAASPTFGKLYGFQSGSIKRYDVSTGNVTTVADFASGISDMCSLTVDPATERWYFHYEGYSGAFDFGNDENVGYATASFLTPSSEVAKITGRALTAKGRGISGVTVKAVGSDGKTVSTNTNTFGYFSLPKLKVGQTYVVSVESKRYFFPVSSEIVVLNEDLDGLDFEAQ